MTLFRVEGEPPECKGFLEELLAFFQLGKAFLRGGQGDVVGVRTYQHMGELIVRRDYDVANTQSKDRRPEHITLTYTRRAAQVRARTQQIASLAA